MCGIAGILATNGARVDEERLQRMACMLRHRGPDNTTVEVGRGIGLAHTRLSLLDLSSNGNQPFSDAMHSLVFNGEIYNFAELRKELQREYGIVFRSGTDTEVLFHLLVRCGVHETVRKIEGMFAFAFHDKATGTLTLARDRIGIKPLFYHRGPHAISFASELKALTGTLDLREDKRRIIRSVFGYLEHSRHYSGFEGVRQVAPGTIVAFREDGTTTSDVYFRTSDLVDRRLYGELDKMPHDAVLNTFESLFKQSVGRMLVADAPIGAFVSGGIDSSLISVVAKQCGKNPLLYSVNVVGRFSEIAFAKKLAGVLETPINVFDFEPEMFLRDWVRTTWHNDAPVVINQHAVPFGNITRLAFENGDKAVLTGEGADELFLGYPRHVRARLEKALRWPVSILQALYSQAPGLRSIPGSQPDRLSEALGMIERQYEDVEEDRQYTEAVSFLPTPYLREMQKLSLKLVDKTLYSLLWRNDRMGMMHSIESRFPFLDENILRFASSLPLKYKIRPTLKFGDFRHPFMVDKYLVRRLAARKLPHVLTSKPKLAFPIHGLETVKVPVSFFSGGYWQDLLDLSNAQVSYMVENTPPALLSRIAAVDIWGRLFCRRESVDSVQSYVLAHCGMLIPEGKHA